MKYDTVPFAPAHFLQGEESSDADVPSVVQARVMKVTHYDDQDEGAIATVADNTSEPTIYVPAQDITVEDDPSKNKEDNGDDESQNGSENNGNNADPDPKNDGPHPQIAALKKRRKRNQKIGLVAGFVAGCIICGPVLGVVGAVGTHFTVKRLGRAKQARLQAELDNNAVVVAVETDQETMEK